MKRILVIEDEEVLRLAIVVTLEKHGYHVLEAEDGDQGIALAHAQLPDLVLSDLSMPGLDGFAVLKSLRSQPTTSAIPVILMTGVEDSPSARLGMERGADDYLCKPFAMQTLVAAVSARLERQAAIEAHAKANEKTLLEILSTTPDLVAITDADSGRLRYLNASGRRMLAIGPEEDIAALGLGDFHTDTETDLAQQEKIAWAKHHDIWMGESAFLNRDGRRVPVSKQILAHRAPSGEVIHLSIVARDITERLAAELALRESEKRYRDLIESQGDGVVLADTVQRFTFANPAAEELLGVPSGGLVGRRLQEFLSETDQATVDEQVKLRREGKRSSYELEIIADGGRRRQMLLSGTPRMDAEGRFCGSLAVLRDITERKQAAEKVERSEQLLRTILDVLPQRVFWKDREGRFLGANRQFLADCGMASVAGKTDSDIPLSRDQAERFRAADQRVIASGLPELDVIEQVVDAAGKPMWLSTSKVPMRNEHGEVVGVLGTYLDLTPLKRAEQERQMMEVQLRQAQKLEAIGQLAAGIAHEINTPTQYVGDNTRFFQDSFQNIRKVLESHAELLHAAKGNALTPELIARAEQAAAKGDLEYLFEQIPAAITETLEGIGRITKIVRAMKEFSHPGGKEKALANLNKAIESTVTVARHEWKYVADMHLGLDPDLPGVPCFLGEFNQAILNLIINAAHTIADALREHPGTKGTITVTTRRDGNHVEVRVSDTGTGIPEAIRPRIFEPFFTTKPVGKGTGQGLSIVYGNVVKKHGGTVRFESEVGKGTTFILRLPLAPCTGDADRERFELGSDKGTTFFIHLPLKNLALEAPNVCAPDDAPNL